MVSFEIIERVQGVLMLLNVKFYTDNTVAVNQLDIKTGLPVKSVEPKLVKSLN